MGKILYALGICKVGWLAEFSEKVGEWRHGDHGKIGTD